MAEGGYSGKWHSTTVENFDEFMKTLGVGYVLRKAGSAAVTYLDISQDGDTWTWSYKIAFKSGTINFKLGEEFDEVTPDGRKVKGTVTKDGDNLVWIQRGKPHDTTITRILTDGGNKINETCVANGVTCKREYVRSE